MASKLDPTSCAPLKPLFLIIFCLLGHLLKLTSPKIFVNKHQGMDLNSLLKGIIVIICLLHHILYSLILLGLYNQMVKGSNFLLL